MKNSSLTRKAIIFTDAVRAQSRASGSPSGWAGKNLDKHNVNIVGTPSELWGSPYELNTSKIGMSAITGDTRLIVNHRSYVPRTNLDLFPKLSFQRMEMLDAIRLFVEVCEDSHLDLYVPGFEYVAHAKPVTHTSGPNTDVRFLHPGGYYIDHTGRPVIASIRPSSAVPDGRYLEGKFCPGDYFIALEYES